MSNSSLVDYVKISPNSTNPRNQKIDTITIHHCAGVVSAEVIADIFAPTSRQASCNYGIGNDGKIALIVDEANRSWCSSNKYNDHRAITIEVSNSANGGNWPVGDRAMSSLIDLCVDICKRNGIEKLNYTGDKTGNLTLHKWFANTNCPGPYLEGKMPWIAEQVNERLNAVVAPTTKPVTPVVKPVAPTVTSDFKVGDEVTLASNATYSNGKSIPGWVKKRKLYVRKVGNDGNITVSILKIGAVTGIVNKKYLTKKNTFVAYKVKVTADVLNIRAGAGLNYKVVGTIADKGIYTIVGVDGTGKWGLLKSGAGWISLSYTKKV